MDNENKELVEKIVPKKRAYKKRSTISSTEPAKKKPRKRAVRKTATTTESTATPKKIARAKISKKTTIKKSLKKNDATEEPQPAKRSSNEKITKTETISRKAPTLLAEDKNIHKLKQKRFITVAVLILIGVSASAAVGYTDKGAINVTQTIEARNERIRTNTASIQDTMSSTVEIPVQDTTREKKVDGGLIGRGVGSASKKPAVQPNTENLMASSTDLVATSTVTTASSTEEVVNESIVNEETELDSDFSETEMINNVTTDETGAEQDI